MPFGIIINHYQFLKVDITWLVH